MEQKKEEKPKKTGPMGFKEAYELPIGDHVDKKGGFSYLSWPFAVRFLRENYKDSTWTIHENEQGLPLFTVCVGEKVTHFVKVTVHHDGKDYTSWLPVLDYKNKPIQDPSSFHINTSIQRCLVKAIGISTGIGLGLYAGEDLPKPEKEDQPEKGSLKDQSMGYIYITFKESLDQCQGVKECEKWWKENSKAIHDQLSGDWLKKINSDYASYKREWKQRESDDFDDKQYPPGR